MADSLEANYPIATHRASQPIANLLNLLKLPVPGIPQEVQVLRKVRHLPGAHPRHGVQVLREALALRKSQPLLQAVQIQKLSTKSMRQV